MELVLFTLFFSISILASAQYYQDSILLINGMSYKANILCFKWGVLHFDIEDKKGESKGFEITQSKLFSYHEKGTETILHENYHGFIDYSSKKRTFGALKGSVIGLGLISYSIFRIN